MMVFSLLFCAQGWAATQVSNKDCGLMALEIAQVIVKTCKEACSTVQNKRDRRECEFSCRLQEADATKIEEECND